MVCRGPGDTPEFFRKAEKAESCQSLLGLCSLVLPVFLLQTDQPLDLGGKDAERGGSSTVSQRLEQD